MLAMKKLVKKVKVRDFQLHLKQTLLYEQDYELASLHFAMVNHNKEDVKRSKARLTEIHSELNAINISINGGMVFS